MFVLPVLTLYLALGLSVNGEPPACPDQQTKDLLQKYKVDGDLTPLLKGNTYVDIWRHFGSTNFIDCCMTKFTEDGDGLNQKVHNVFHEGDAVIIETKWKENKGASSFHAVGDFREENGDVVHYNEHVHIFYADKTVYGYFSCDIVDSTIQMAISVRTDKEQDPETLESIKKAKDIMDNLKGLMPEGEMTHFARKQCPSEI